MLRRRFAMLVALVVIAAACGTAVSDKDAASELRLDAAAGGASAGGSGTRSAVGSGNDTGSDGLSAGTDTGGADGADGATATGAGSTGSATGSGSPGAAGGPTTTAAGAASGGASAANVSKGGATDVGVTPTEIRLGWVGTLTGPVPGIFKGALVGTQAFINYQNSKGGIMGRQLKLIPADDSLDSGKNRAAHLSLKDKIFAFVGSFSINDDGGAPVVNECSCPDVTGNLSAQMHASPMHYGPQPAAPGWRSGPPRYYAQKFGKDVIEHMAFFFSQNAVSESIAVQQRRVYEAAGFKIVYTRGIPPNDSNQTADVVQMQRAGVRAIAYQGDLASMGKLVNAMRQQNFKVDLLNLGNAMYDANTFKVTTPDALENLTIDQVYAMFLGEDAAAIPEVNVFREWMKKTDPNQMVDLFALYGWLSGRLFTDAMTKMAQAGKNPVRKELVDTLRTWGMWDGNGLVAPVNVGQKKPSDCFFVFTATKDAKFARVFPGAGKSYVCDAGPFSPKP